jgi:hypothetical protein
VSGWIKRSVGLPEPGVDVLYVTKYMRRGIDPPVIGCRRKLDEQWYWGDTGNYDHDDYEHDVTHWMPLPELPE